MATVLGLCFRLLADPKNSDSVVNTAAATVRQALAPNASRLIEVSRQLLIKRNDIHKYIFCSNQ